MDTFVSRSAYEYVEHVGHPKVLARTQLGLGRCLHGRNPEPQILLHSDDRVLE
jgi:hypothetical protein